MRLVKMEKVKNWVILLVQSFTACMPLLRALIISTISVIKSVSSRLRKGLQSAKQFQLFLPNAVSYVDVSFRL